MSRYSDVINANTQLEIAKGNAIAEAQRQSGAIWGQTIGNIGKLVANLPGQLAQQKTLQLQQQEAQLRLAQAKQFAAGQQQTDQLMQGDQLPPGDQGPREASYLGADGLFDIPKLNQALAKSGMGHLSQELLKPAEAINDSITKHQALEQQLATQHLLMIGDLADGTLKLAKAGTPLLDAMDFVAQPALATKRIKPEEYAQVRQQIGAMPPEQQAAVLTHFMDQAAKLDKGETLAKDAVHVDRYGRTIASNVVAPTPTVASLDAEYQKLKAKEVLAAAGKGDPLTDAEQAQIKGYEARVDERRAGSGEVKAGSFEDYVQRYAQGKGKGIDALTTADIEDARKRYQQADDRPRVDVRVNDQAMSDVKETIKGMKDGTLPPILPGRATKEYNALLAEAHRQGFDLSAAATDWAATQKHVSTLNGSQQTRLNQSINALPELLDSVDTLASQWKAGRFPPLNRAKLALAKNGGLGSQAATIARQLDAQIADVTADLGNVYMGGNSPTDHALELAGKSLGADWDEKTLHDMVTLARKNVTIRQNSIRNTGVQGASANNPYAPPTVPAGVEQWERGSDGKLHKVTK